MKNKLIGLWVALFVLILFIPVSAQFIPPYAGMSIAILLLMILTPAFFVVVGGFLAPHWKSLWWMPVALGVAFVGGMRLVLGTWDIVAYLPIYLPLAYLSMAVCAIVDAKRQTKK